MRIDAMVDEAAHRAGLSREECDELLVPTCDLADGRRRERFGGYQADLVLTARDAVELRWSKVDGGQPLRSEPAGVRRDFGDELKVLKA
jgi:hypothetical protein